MNIIKGYCVSKYEFRLVKNDYHTAVEPDIYHGYEDIESGMLYLWDNKEYRDASFFQSYEYGKFDNLDVILPNNIYLALPGHRMIGRINGIDEDSCSLTNKLNNTKELSFTVNRFVDGIETEFYDQIDRVYELYLPDYGWFKINDEPQIENDGIVEKKSISAESLEIELQQYDLVDFYINTGDTASKEMLATDNTYELDNADAVMFRDNVLFYRDTTKLETAIEEFANTDGSVEALKTFVETHRELIYRKDPSSGVSFGCWRITLDENNEIQIDATHASTKEEIKQEITYPDYTGTEILDMELTRQHELSLLWLILHEHNWEIGFVDPTVDIESESQIDKIPLANRVDVLEIDTQDIYSVLTQEVAQKYRCIFVFDTVNYRVNAYSLKNIGYDTNIYLSFRNIQNQVTRSSDRELYTVLHVQGDEELDFTEVNYGSNTVTDISYFLNTDHFSQEFIDKYKAWLAYCDSHRNEYKEYSVQYRNYNDKANEIYSRVPIDNIEGKQYSTMSLEELAEEKANMIALKEGIEDYYQDEYGNFDIDACRASDDWATYDGLVNIILSDPYTAKIAGQMIEAIDYVILVEGTGEHGNPTVEQSFDYDKYEQDTGIRIDSYRLGQIDIAIFNRRVIDGYYTDDEMSQSEKQMMTNPKNQIEYIDDAVFRFDQYGYMYGVAELEAQLKTIENTLNTLETNGYDSSDGMPYDEEAIQKYEKYRTAQETCKLALQERKEEYEDALADVQSVQNSRLQMIEDVDITNPQFGFTEEELKLLDKYYIHTDYKNENILITDIFTNEQIIEAEYQLYLDAVDQAYVESHPQYLWSTTLDNLLLMPEFRDWHRQLHVGNYIWLSFRDDYQVKLRVSTITLNPLMIDPEIQIEFTTMTSYKSRRNDYADLLASSNSSMKNQISSSINSRSNRDNTVNIDTALIIKLLNSQAFSGYMGSNNQNANVSAALIAADSITAADINVGQIVGQQAQFDELFSNYIRSNIIAAKLAAVDILDATQISADSAFIESLQSLSQTTAQSTITDAYIQNAIIGKVTAGQLKAGDLYLTNAMRILSENGMLVMNGSTMQIGKMVGEEGQEKFSGIQIGYGTGQDASIIITDDNGTTMMTSTGITSDAIADGLIVNNMIQNSTIAKSKLNFPIVDTDENGNISITSIKDGTGGNFGVEYSSFKQGTIDAIDDINSKKMYRVEIESNNGNIFKNGEINCTLSCHVFSWDDEITDDINAANFIWSRTSKYPASDSQWNINHSGGTKTLTLTSADVWGRCVFRCTVTLPDGSSITGE